MYVPRATYSFKMSFCTVPESRFRFAPCRFATATYSASKIAAVELIVIEVETRSSGMPSNSVCMSSSESMATPTLSDFAFGESVIGVQSDLRRQIERDGKARLAVREQIAITPIRFARRCRSRRIAASSTAGRDTSWGRCRA